MKNNFNRQLKRKTRIRSKIARKGNKPRITVFRSNKFISAQIIDDTKNTTIIGVSEKDLKDTQGTKTDKAKAMGLLLAKKAKTKKVTKIVFDRGSYAYHGRVKRFAEGLREGGVEF